jgi:voltage-gated potassium channel
MNSNQVHPTRRLGVNAFVERHATAWELTMAFLAVVSVAVGLIAVEAAEPPVLVAIEWGLTFVFCVEYGLRLWASPDRGYYFRHHLIDLISIIPPVRGARLLRLLRLLRVASDLSRILSNSQLSSQRKLLGTVALFWAVVVAISSLGMYLAESAVNPNVTSIFDSLWWAVVTITTVGYGDVSPVTSEGRLAAGVLMVLGIVLFSTLTAALTSALTSSSEAMQSANERLEALERLREAARITDLEYSEVRARILRDL